jgi:predicted lipoprotein with Yx(FWY)xxD motif
MRVAKSAGSILALGVLAAACGSGGGGGGGDSSASSASSAPAGGGAYGAPTTAPSTPAAAAGAEVDAKKVSLGTIAVDGKGMTLYMFEKDKGGKSTCYGACATAWPPLLTSDKAMAGSGVMSSLLGTTKRTDGKTQVTYNKWPLYYCVKDKKPGDTMGQDVDGFGAEWYVLSAAKGTKLEK